MVERSLSTDAEFRGAYDRHVAAIRRYCQRRLPRPDVDDATAEVFLVAWRRVDRMPGGDETLLWLYGVARNVVRNQQRTARRAQRLRSRVQLASPGGEDTATQVIRRIEDQEVLDALGGLRPSDQEILRLAAWEGLKPAAIGQVLGIRPHAASMRLGRARDRLARLLQIEEQEPQTAAIPRPVSEGGER
ncbi:MAG: sigma-70 family RNA polymerase sigma factor [Acidimicrobiia bacterium]|nr:sigma-70 family RNA polymerase sigma factor [Acidimicrobiia bacterium]